jgi:hypothetical protein
MCATAGTVPSGVDDLSLVLGKCARQFELPSPARRSRPPPRSCRGGSRSSCVPASRLPEASQNPFSRSDGSNSVVRNVCENMGGVTGHQNPPESDTPDTSDADDVERVACPRCGAEPRSPCRAFGRGRRDLPHRPVQTDPRAREGAACRPRPTAAPDSRGARAHRRRRRSPRTRPARTSGSAMPAAHPSAKKSRSTSPPAARTARSRSGRTGCASQLCGLPRCLNAHCLRSTTAASPRLPVLLAAPIRCGRKTRRVSGSLSPRSHRHSAVLGPVPRGRDHVVHP